ncbi:MAG TPA: valine--tRNA ligase, partial [Deltaproteobacteria bacterium]|nr:valine--tRNA ligase [Deltaproteobacteria bacterium]
MTSLAKTYNPQEFETDLYQQWEEGGWFRADAQSDKPSFTISMPPPNATGQLHVGHAVMLALEDILIRWHRMRGYEALWVPGTDHAAIATENVVLQKIQREEGIKDPRKELGREEVLRRIADYVVDSRDTIKNQVRAMGSSCDWSRDRYTMDPPLNRCVNETFSQMYADGLIYRGHRIVNWDPKLQTNVSDDEVDRKEVASPFYTFQYGPFQIGTVRPETKFGDKYVVMHPDDERYSEFNHGDTFECEWINGPVEATIIKDSVVDPSFGTGVMTITPWHDHTDFEIAERHQLDKEQIIDFQGRLLANAGEFAGMPIEEARPKIVEKLAAKGLLVKTDGDYVNSKAFNSRGGGSIEPQIREQWFIDVNKPVVPWKGEKRSLREILIAVVREGDIQIVPDRFNNTYFHWVENLRDWCISRQIWWGHRVPVWYRGEGDSAEIQIGVAP